MCTLDDFNSNFKNIVTFYRSPGSDEKQFSTFIDFETFKRALVRLALNGKENGEAPGQIIAEIESRMAEEYAAERGPSGNEKDFQMWMQKQEEIGNGVRARLYR
jgi:hypothetical protein